VSKREADSIKVFVLNVFTSSSFTLSGSTKPISTRPRVGLASLGGGLEMIGDRKTSDSRSVFG
jgi:hypothetical protein